MVVAVRLRPEVRRTGSSSLLSSPAEAVVVAAVVGGITLDAISIDDRDALDDVKSGERLTRLGSFVIVVVVLVLAIAAGGSCGIEDEEALATLVEDDDDDDGGKTSSFCATGRIAVDKLFMMLLMGQSAC